jgi:predicted TIM-barrel fold metal-dependent hydrolase
LYMAIPGQAIPSAWRRYGAAETNQLDNSRAKWLIDLFLKYPQARFDILHASFPYTAETAEIAKIFPNVYLNAAWTDTLSPIAYKNLFKEWLTYVPLNKLFAFGSDQFNVLSVAANAERVRDLIATALTELIEEG